MSKSKLIEEIEKLNSSSANMKYEEVQKKIESLIQEEQKSKASKLEFTVFGDRSKEWNEEICRPAQIPVIKPLFRLNWGDGPNDQIETHDNEVLEICAYNPYSNIEMKGLKISYIFVSPTSTLPNGAPSVQVHTSSGVCFGDIKPCTKVCRDFMLTVQGEAPGNHKLYIIYHLDELCIANRSGYDYDLFNLEFVNS